MINNKEVIGHETVINSLTKQIINNQLAQTYIFSGPPNIGKTIVSQWFIESIACKNYSANKKACKSCLNCQVLISPASPALIHIGQETDSQSISIESIRNTKKNIKLGLSDGIRRFVVVDSAELLTESAANSLLKLIEEPPNNTYIILRTSQISSLPATIVSRSQVINFRKVPLDTLKDAAKSYTSIATGSRHEIIHAADGRPGQMIRWLNNAEDFTDYKELVRSLAGQLAEPDITTVDDLEDSFKDPTIDLAGGQILLTILRDSLYVQTNRNKQATNQFIFPTLTKISARYGLLTSLADRAIQLNRDLRANVNVKLALENYFIQAQNEIS